MQAVTEITPPHNRRIQWGFAGYPPMWSTYQARLLVRFDKDQGAFRAGDYCMAFTKEESAQLWKRVQHLRPTVVKDRDGITAVTAT